MWRLGQAWIGEPFELLAHATECRGDRTPSCLGGMRGEDRIDSQRGELLSESGIAELGADGGECGCERLGRTGGAVVSLPKRPSAVALLREVDEVEIARERAGHLLGPIQ